MKKITFKKYFNILCVILTYNVVYSQENKQINNEIQTLKSYINEVLKSSVLDSNISERKINLIKNQTYLKITKIDTKDILKNWNKIIQKNDNTFKELVLLNILYSNINYAKYCDIIETALKLYQNKILTLEQFKKIFYFENNYFIWNYKQSDTIELIKKIIASISDSDNNSKEFLIYCENILNGQHLYNNLRYMVHFPNNKNIETVNFYANCASINKNIIWNLLSQVLGQEVFIGFSVYEPEPFNNIKMENILSAKNTSNINTFLSTPQKRPNTITDKVILIEQAFNFSYSSLPLLKKALDSSHYSISQKEIIIDILLHKIYFQGQVDFIIYLLNEDNNKISKYVQIKLSQKLFNSQHIEKEKIIRALKKEKYMNF